MLRFAGGWVYPSLLQTSIPHRGGLPRWRSTAAVSAFSNFAYDSLNTCIERHPGARASDTVQKLSAARDSLAAKPLNATNEFSEGLLGIAEKTWQTRVALRGSGVSPEEEPLRLIIEKLVQ